MEIMSRKIAILWLRVVLLLLHPLYMYILNRYDDVINSSI